MQEFFIKWCEGCGGKIKFNILNERIKMLCRLNLKMDGYGEYAEIVVVQLLRINYNNLYITLSKGCA